MNPKTFATQRYHFTSIIATQFVQLSINNHSCCLSALVLCKPFIFLLFLFGKSIWYFSVVFLFVFCIYISWDKARKASFLLISNRNAQFFNAFALVLLSLFNLASFEMQIGKWVSREGEREREGEEFSWLGQCAFVKGSSLFRTGQMRRRTTFAQLDA